MSEAEAIETGQFPAASSGSSKPATPAHSVQPIAMKMTAAAAFLGVSEMTIRRLLAQGTVRGVKAGRSTLILTESLRAYVAGLPPATYRTPTKAAG